MTGRWTAGRMLAWYAALTTGRMQPIRQKKRWKPMPMYPYRIWPWCTAKTVSRCACAGYNTIAKVPFGAEVTVLESSDDWATITWNGQRGYMQKKYLRLIGMAEPPDNGNEDPMSFEAKVLAKLDEILLLLKGGEG